jgi:hypothetical protein
MNWRSAMRMSMSIGWKSKPGASVGTANNARVERAGAGVLRAAHDQHVIGLIDAGDVDLAPDSTQSEPSRRAVGGDAVRVGPGVGS